jgi:hypothetical protein
MITESWKLSACSSIPHTLSLRPVPQMLSVTVCVFSPFEGQLSFLTEHLPVDSKPTELRSIAVDAETCSTLQSSTKSMNSNRACPGFPRFMERMNFPIDYSLLQPRSAPEDATPRHKPRAVPPR